MLDFFNKITAYFNSRNIPYMLSDSIAMGIYILPRATRDIGFVVNLRLQDIDSLVEYFEGAY